jgi:Cu(I)/Ag(I) efflux system protein CusF
VPWADRFTKLGAIAMPPQCSAVSQFGALGWGTLENRGALVVRRRAKLGTWSRKTMFPIKAVGVVTIFALALASSQLSLSQEVLADGQIIKIDEQAGKIGLTHGPIQSLDMNEGGKDDFKVKDGLVFNALKVGDKIRFAAERVNGEPTITKIEK